MTDTADPLLSTSDIAALLNVKRRTVYAWEQRPASRLPPCATVAANRRLWRRSAILEWARETKRMPAKPTPEPSPAP